jgi:hypothetical protein
MDEFRVVGRDGHSSFRVAAESEKDSEYIDIEHALTIAAECHEYCYYRLIVRLPNYVIKRHHKKFTAKQSILMKNTDLIFYVDSCDPVPDHLAYNVLRKFFSTFDIETLQIQLSLARLPRRLSLHPILTLQELCVRILSCCENAVASNERM